MSLTVAVASRDERPACLAVRHAVFIVEQQVPADLEVDGEDPHCVHVLARWDGEPVGTARLREVDGHAKAERVAVVRSSRGRGIGLALMSALEQEARARGFGEMHLHAQAAVIGFYEDQGYAGQGERFVEAGIEHVAMVKRLG